MDRGWELAAAVVGTALAVAVLAAIVGVGLAAAWWGGGWVWPRGTEAMSAVVAGVVRGQPWHGYPGPQRALLASTPLTYTGIAVVEALTWAVVLRLAVAVQRHVLPNDARGGMATRADARRALGVGRLRGAAPIIRPDLHPSGD